MTTSVTLARHDGPITFARGTHRAILADLRVVRTDSGVALSDDRGFEVDLVEHLLAALGGLGIDGQVMATVEGPEIPILDGGARCFVDALHALEIPGAPARWAVQKAARLTHRDSSYEFEVGDRVELSVEASFDHPAVPRQRATWNGDARAFAENIAPARTFGFARQADDLWAKGRAKLAAFASQGDPSAIKAFGEAVLVFDEHGLVNGPHRTAPLLPNELARHKLLDLVGDLMVHGGPPRGRITAVRPGHTVTHRIISEAISLGILSSR